MKHCRLCLKNRQYYEVENKTKIKISNVKYQSDAPLSYAYNEDKTKDFCVITFDINVSESESKDMLNIGLDYLSIGAVDNLGTETRSLVSIDDEMIEKYNAQQKFEFLNIYPSSNTIKCITCVSISEGSKLQLVHFVYYNENGEKCNIYVNPE